MSGAPAAIVLVARSTQEEESTGEEKDEAWVTECPGPACVVVSAHLQSNRVVPNVASSPVALPRLRIAARSPPVHLRLDL